MDDTRQQVDKPYAPLTNRERDILALLAQDLTDKEIAERLFLAHTTVRWFNRQIFNKLGVENRVQAVERAKVLGLLRKAETLEDTDFQATHNLPAQLTPFIGRERELEELVALLHAPQMRFITLLAPGGMGKTRLALASAEQVLTHFPDGVYFVPLAPLTTAEQIISAIAEACGFQFAPDSRPPKQQILDFLRAKSLLLVLDNFEHLLDGAVLVSDLLQAAPQVTILVTSRERLHLSIETVYTLVGLPYPKGINEDDVSNYAAVQLFIGCALRVQPHFKLTDVASVVRICQLVQGMPLAIELAAAWMASLSPQEIAEEIERSVDFLRTTMRDVPERLRSVRAVFEAAWKRLTEDEQRVFSKLSVFRGGFTREAAQAVASADAHTLTRLVNKALVWRNAETGRYDIHELLRQYGEGLLQESEAIYLSTMDKHCEWFATSCEQISEVLKSPRLSVGLRVIEADFNNIQLGWRWATKREQYDRIWRYLFSIYYFAWLRSRLQSIERDYQQVAQTLAAKQEANQQLTLQITLLSLLAWMQNALGNYTGARETASKCLAAANEWDEAEIYPITIIALAWLAWLLLIRDAVAEGIKWGEKSILLSRTHHYRFDLGLALVIYGYGFVNCGDMQTAEPLLGEAEQIAAELGHPHLLGAVAHFRGTVQLARGEFIEAKTFLEDIIEVFRNLGDWWNLSGMLLTYADVLLKLEDYDATAQVLSDFIRLVIKSGGTHGVEIVLIQYFKLFAATKRKTRAVEVAAYWLTSEQKKLAGDAAQRTEELHGLLAQLETELPPDIYQAAVKRGEQITLEELLKELLSQ
jgi:predicted ATPase/DNA-binding CsgD family transcriptional regulator